MTRTPSDLFKKRSATNEFLVSSSDESAAKDDGVSARPDTGPDEDTDLAAGFPSTLDRQGLRQAVETDYGAVVPICVLAVRLTFQNRRLDASKKESRPSENLAAVLGPLVDICRDCGGIWARIGNRRFAFAFPRADAKTGREIAKRMQTALPSDNSVGITAGVALYPTANETRAQTVDNAEKALEHAGFFGPGSITEFDAVSLNISGDRLYQAGDIRGAIGEFEKGLRLDPCDTNLLNSLGVCHGVLEEYAQALTAFETAIWLAPEEIMPVYNRGFIFLRQGQTRQALDAFLAANAMESGVFEVVFHIGQIHMDSGRPEQARPYLEAAVRANNRSAAAYRQLGACLDRLGLTKEAVQAYKAVVKINPEDAASLSMLGRLYAKRGESLDVAAVLCEQSVRIAPDNGLFRHRLGRVYLELGRLDVALAEFELAAAQGYDSRVMIEETQDRMMASKAS
ncbi:tetratricopeptide repeat protein [uncultured Desulfosarcina sp.]|uniref:tetratricopeptide repeat protein n=1 Tax=uncultured Desulfosarcina sp. TaxID=218289 RepID=UPI0029C753C7|nr:tetratricopeptide repeat protein [uncultured Desulfosarcina sp.]